MQCSKTVPDGAMQQSGGHGAIMVQCNNLSDQARKAQLREGFSVARRPRGTVSGA
jgi:hypothetical protein